jgi:hypothetical protein
VAGLSPLPQGELPRGGSTRVARLGAALALLALAAFHALGVLVGGYRLPQGTNSVDIALPELAFLGTYCVLGSLCWVGLTAALAGAAPGEALVRLARRLLEQPQRVALACAAACVVGSALLRSLWLRGQVLADDELTYDFIASTLLEGRLSNPPPLPAVFLRNQFVYASDTAWHGKYPIGHPLLLACGRLLGAQGMVVPILGGLGVLLTYAVGCKLLDRRAAAAACLLLALSPHYVLTHATQLSQPTSMVCTLLAALGLLRLLETQRLRWAALAGGALGFGILTRPAPVGLFAPALLWAYIALLPPRAFAGQLGRRTLELASMGVGLALGLGVLAWVNTVQYGGPLHSGAEAVHDTTGVFRTQGLRIQWSVLGSLLRENFWLHGWPLSLLLLPFARFGRGGPLVWSLVLAELAYRVVVPKTVFATTGPIYLLEVVPLLCLASVAGARGVAQRWRRRGAAPERVGRWLVGGAVAGTLIGALLFMPTALGAVRGAVDARLGAYAAIERAGLGRALVFANALVHPASERTWAYYAPSPAPRLDDDLIFVRYLYGADDYARMHALWREHFADRRAALYLLTPDGRPELRELPVDSELRPALPPEILYALPPRPAR